MGIISWVVVGLIAGWLTGKIMGGPGKGALMDIVVGLVGAVAGGFIVGIFGLRPDGGLISTIVVAVIGAVVLTWIYRRFVSRSV